MSVSNKSMRSKKTNPLMHPINMKAVTEEKKKK